MKKITPSFFSLILVATAFLNAFAGGPLQLFAPGQPYRWANGGTNIPFNPDQGGLGPLNNAAAVAQVTNAFGQWANVSTSTVTHLNAGLLPLDVDESNFLPFLDPAAPDGRSAIVFDEDGAIFDLLFGPGSGVLGFAGPEWINTTNGQIIEGVSFMNGGAFLGVDPFPITEIQALLVHEFGHYQNLAHTVINGQVAGFGDFSGPEPNDTFPIPPLVNRIETMYPFLFINGGQGTVHKDDISSISSIYPEPTFASSTGTITGRIIAPNGTTLVTGVNVIARNVANPFDDAVSALSSDYTDSFVQGGPFVGVYTFRGVTPGAQYAIYVDEIIAGGFNTPPAALPGREEFYNGVNESFNSATDDPAVFTPVSVAAGGTASGIDIIFNRVSPGPIEPGDDGFVEIYPAFPITICGQRFESFFVNGNGNVTFGGPSSSFSESIPGFLLGLPRVAGLWDDLDPSSGGTVTYSENATSVTIRFENVPEFFATNSNTFEIKLYRNFINIVGNRFDLNYGNIDATDGLTGYSCGGRVSSGFEKERDFSSLRNFSIGALIDTAVFEVFTNDNDLDNGSVRFLGTIEPEDVYERNNSRSRARQVLLPFSSADRFRYTEIEPTGDDVDYYKFHAKAGEIVVAETIPGGQVDTVLGLFDRNGNLLIGDDDSGAGVLSRLAFTLPADGDYFVAVSTFDDFDFTGDGLGFGRYVLNINTYKGTVIPVGDDNAVQVPFTTFAFPFQGSNRTSVFVNGNGNLTFGAASSDFSESVPEFLVGPPRIAPMWDDLDPSAGLVIAEEKNQTLTIHYISVPEFFASNSNYFSVTMGHFGDVAFNYGPTARSDALVGVTQGNGAADPGPVDLSRANSLSVAGTTYEQFINPSGLDLSFYQLRFR